LGEVKPSRHASGDQVRAYLGAGPHGQNAQKILGVAGNRGFGLFAVF
jgi:hypothetical protein